MKEIIVAKVQNGYVIRFGGTVAIAKTYEEVEAFVKAFFAEAA